MHHPLQQGLRLQCNTVGNEKVGCTSASSITTRIKTIIPAVIQSNRSAQVHHPLQQGLRLESVKALRQQRKRVQVHHPLQQGLRLNDKRTLCFKALQSTSASSITTRIKT